MDDPTDLPSCIAAVIDANATLTNSASDLDDQTALYGYNSDSINWIRTADSPKLTPLSPSQTHSARPVSSLVQTLFLVLLIDRIVSLGHRPTKIVFWIAVVSSILFEILNVVGNAVPWFFTLGGNIIYFYGRAVFASTNQWAVCHMLYLRVSDALTRRFGRKIAMIAFGLTAAVLPLELAKQGYGAILWSVTLNQDQPLYLSWLNYLSAAYRSALDLTLSGYSFWIIHTAASGDRSSHHRGRLMREDTAFFVGYAARVLLFVGVDILFVISTSFSSGQDDTSFESMSLWACAQLMSPIRPYLICTDMARIRALSAESPDEATLDAKVK